MEPGSPNLSRTSSIASTTSLLSGEKPKKKVPTKKVAKPTSTVGQSEQQEKEKLETDSKQEQLASVLTDIAVNSRGNAALRNKLSPRLILGGGDDYEVYSVRFSYDGRFVCAGCGDGTIKVYSTNSGRLAFQLKDTTEDKSVTGSPAPTKHDSNNSNSNNNNTSDNNNSTNTAPSHRASRYDVSTLPTTCVRFRPTSPHHKTKNILIAANSDGTLRHWHVTSEKCVHTITEENNQIYACDYRSDAEKFATAGKDFKVRIYDESTKTLSSTLFGGHGDITAGHANRVFSLKFSPNDPHVVVSGGWDNTVQIWDIRVQHSIRSIFGPHICGDAVDIYNNIVLTGSWRPENNLQMWDFGTGKLISNVAWQSSLGTEPCLLYACQFSKSNNAEFIAAGGSGSNETKVFHRLTNKVIGEIAEFKKGVYSVDFSHDGKMICIGGAGMCALYDIVKK